MGKKKTKHKKEQQRSANQRLESQATSQVTPLELLFLKRTGGARNITGIGFQLIYSCYLILSKLSGTDQIRLEGLEDVDYISRIDNGEYIQLKSSKNNITESRFWEMKVLQNFLEVFILNPNAKFKLVHNTTFSKGKLQEIASRKITDEVIDFWKDKFTASEINISEVDIGTFLKSIEFEKVNERSLIQECLGLLIKKFELNAGTEIQFFNALFTNVFQWSKDRSIRSSKDIDTLILSVKDSFSKHPNNPAIQNSWIIAISFTPTSVEDVSDYFDGKAAKPIHIANDLPVTRKIWENEIENSINDFAITLIRASSGQGKSTLAWLVSKTLSQRGYTIFQLTLCSEPGHISHLVDFIESRIKIGQIPLVIIDGLDQTVSNWGAFAERIKTFPARILITSREEDWYRLGYDESKIVLKPIQIKLSIQEAENIFSLLKDQKKLHKDRTNWQPAWEKVEERGLLIEYVYLITQGQMIKERLQEQIKKLNDERSGAAKIEILRLVSLADVMNIKLQTRKITDYISSTVRFENDRNEVYKQLEKEYYIKFNNKYIEGLHPVRSAHLVDILHSAISKADSLVRLFPLIEDESIYDFFTNAPFLISLEEKDIFYNQLVPILSQKKIQEIVNSIDGFMYTEAKKYWSNNKEIFDEVAQNGGIELFIYDTLPFTKLNTIKNLNSMEGLPSGFDYLSAKLDQLTDYSIDGSDIFYFVQRLQVEIISREEIQIYDGISFFAKWFNRLNLDFPKVFQIKEQLLLDALKNKSIKESAEFFGYYNLAYPKKYEDFIHSHKNEIIGWIKRKTNTLTIQEEGENIQINYLLEDNNDNVNESSVSRINILHEFFPNYKLYCAKAINLPFPNESIYEAILQNSFREMPKKNIVNEFDVHINQIWLNAILNNYIVRSIYEWQKQYIDVRLLGIEFAKTSTCFFELYIEKNVSRFKNTANDLDTRTDLLRTLRRTLRNYSNNEKYHDHPKFGQEQKKINTWVSSLMNFINQMTGIIFPKGTNDRNLAEINLKNTFFKLPEMQEAFASVVNATFEYFPNKEMNEQEFLWFERLLKTVQFYIHWIEKGEEQNFTLAKVAIENWYSKDQLQRLEQLSVILKSFEKESLFVFHLPEKIIEEETLKYAVIGVEYFNLEEELSALAIGLLDLDQTDFDFFTFVNIYQGEANWGFRIGRNFFERVRKELETGEMEDSSFGNPLPVVLDENLIRPLTGIKLRKMQANEDDNAFYNMMVDVWKLSEYRARLIYNSEVEKNWLIEIEIEYKNKILTNLERIKNSISKSQYDIVTKFLDDKIKLSKEEIVFLLNQKVHELNKQVITNKANATNMK